MSPCPWQWRQEAENVSGIALSVWNTEQGGAALRGAELGQVNAWHCQSLCWPSLQSEAFGEDGKGHYKHRDHSHWMFTMNLKIQSLRPEPGRHCFLGPLHMSMAEAGVLWLHPNNTLDGFTYWLLLISLCLFLVTVSFSLSCWIWLLSYPWKELRGHVSRFLFLVSHFCFYDWISKVPSPCQPFTSVSFPSLVEFHCSLRFLHICDVIV